MESEEESCDECRLPVQKLCEDAVHQHRIACVQEDVCEMVDCGIQPEERVLDLMCKQRERDVEFRVVRGEDLEEVQEGEAVDFRVINDQKLIIEQQELKSRCLQIHEKAGQNNANKRQETPFPQSSDHRTIVEELAATMRAQRQTPRQHSQHLLQFRHLQLLPPLL